MSFRPRIGFLVHLWARGVVVAVLLCSGLALEQLQASAQAGAANGSNGYIEVLADGEILSYGTPSLGSITAPLNAPIVGAASDPLSPGYWLVGSDGGVFSFGAAAFYGSTGGTALNRPIVGMAAEPGGGGYWLVAGDGGVFAFGDAQFYGSTGAIHLNEPVVGMASTPDGRGYWLVASDGGVFSFGDAAFYGSTGAIHLNRPVVGMATTTNGTGYWLVASDGGIFAFGDAPFEGSTGALHLNAPVTGMATDAATGGYWLVASDGGLFSFNAAFSGSAGGSPLPSPVVAMAALAPPPPPPPPCPVPVSGPIPPPTGGRHYWIISTPAIQALEQGGLSTNLINFFFNNRDTFVIGNPCQAGVSLPYATPVLTATSEATMAQPKYFKSLPGLIDGILYDNERWSFTPTNEQNDPVAYARMAHQLTASNGRLLVFTPAVDLFNTGGPEYQNYLNADIAGQGAQASDIFEIQSQGLELNPSDFDNFVRSASTQAKAASPGTILLAGLSTNSSAGSVTGQALLSDYEATISELDGFWLNIPQTGPYCPTCGPPQPGPAVQFLKALGQLLGVR